ncbi:thioredoxin fold domain-containing protein [Saprospiraceae bacterium]|nr:thioredoxin fold domain-containing protein [Saprospiraceae bacterium]
MKNYSYLAIVFFSFCMLLSSCGTNDAKSADSAKLSKAEVTPTKQMAAKAPADHSKTGAMSWHSMSDVESLVKNEKKMVLVDVYTKWCGPCKMMDARTFTDASVQAAIDEKFYPVKFDAEGAGEINFKGKTWANPKHDPHKTRGRNSRHELADFFKVPGYPTLVVMDDNFNIIKKIVGYKTPDALNEILATI